MINYLVCTVCTSYYTTCTVCTSCTTCTVCTSCTTCTVCTSCTTCTVCTLYTTCTVCTSYTTLLPITDTAHAINHHWAKEVEVGDWKWRYQALWKYYFTTHKSIWECFQNRSVVSNVNKEDWKKQKWKIILLHDLHRTQSTNRHIAYEYYIKTIYSMT